MSRYIDADELIPLIRLGETNEYTELGVGRNGGIAFAIERIKQMPTADVRENVHGEWIWLSSTHDRIPCEMKFWCSVCHHEVIIHSSELSKPWENFCPNCGADMREVKE